ncbi:phosphatase PAP2/dual specificity phosphatase family protein [Providencia manganoxydans]|uniref:phosphatase PAP2/dual specificity phosphatase family protein n=1 Tax=Providencia manganoxydans TaxID=2923283 RepID=UPI002940E886|nr:phosphatase PAP2/dual specificity phosphatase family protein [Providencia stuartii]ELR5083852.1 phosphatase PAP2/dual specificity phosphatase family protein [Providencia stuartii]
MISLHKPLPSASRRQIWLYGLIWLIFLAPFFFLTYGQVNTYTASLSQVSSYVYSWEKHIPFLAWSIIPYWSIDLFYGLSLFICTSVREQTIHALRLIAGSLAACIGFLLFPLKFSFPRPETSHITGWMFDRLEIFDLPYNQAPSLHIILLWLLWLRFRAHLPAKWHWILHSWSLLILFSVLTTWQHHFIDVISGFAVGVIISYLLPIDSQWHWHYTGSRRSFKISINYGIGALIGLFIAITFQGGAWILLWPAITFLLITLGYLGLGASVFQKTPEGALSPSACILLLPYRLIAIGTYHYYASACRQPSKVSEHIILGGRPLYPLQTQAVFDMTCEWPRNAYSKNLIYRSQPQIDLLPISAKDIERAVHTMDELAKRGSIYVHCKLGYSRSATVVIAWLVHQHQAKTIDDAIKIVTQVRPQVILNEATIEQLNHWYQKYHSHRRMP